MVQCSTAHAAEPPALVDPRDPPAPLDQRAYQALSDFRYLLRRFMAFSETAATAAGLTPRQHQALLAIKGFAGDTSPTIGDLAERLGTRHHSAVELADRLVDAGLVARAHDAQDRRKARLGLTAAGEDRLASLSAAHLEELHRLRPALLQILGKVGEQPKDAMAGVRFPADGGVGETVSGE